MFKLPAIKKKTKKPVVQLSEDNDAVQEVKRPSFEVKQSIEAELEDEANTFKSDRDGNVNDDKQQAKQGSKYIEKMLQKAQERQRERFQIQQEQEDAKLSIVDTTPVDQNEEQVEQLQVYVTPGYLTVKFENDLISNEEYQQMLQQFEEQVSTKKYEEIVYGQTLQNVNKIDNTIKDSGKNQWWLRKTTDLEIQQAKERYNQRNKKL